MSAKTTNDELYNTSVVDDEPEPQTDPVAPISKPQYSTNVDDISNDDINYPVLKIGQGTTPEVTEGKAQIGQLYLTDRGSFGKTVDVVPVGFYQGSNENPKTKQPEPFIAFRFYLPQFDQLCEAYFRKSNMKAAKDILGVAKREGRVGTVGFTLSVESKKNPNNNATYFVYGVSIAHLSDDVLQAAQAHQ